jgi:hypothetical protein
MRQTPVSASPAYRAKADRPLSANLGRSVCGCQRLHRAKSGNSTCDAVKNSYAFRQLGMPLRDPRTPAIDKSFLVLFFKKELLSSLPKTEENFVT